jgi:hypothetical protein
LLKKYITSAERSFSSAIIHELSYHCSQDPSLALAYFYFDFNDGNKQTVRNLVCSLVTQFSRRCSSFPESLATLYSNCLDGQHQPTTTSLKQVLRDILGTFPHAYIVVDALDECSERDDLLSVLEEITSWNQDSLHILATSRPDRMTIERLSCGISHVIDIQGALVDADIRIHVRERLQNEFSLSKWPSKVKVEIESGLMEGAKGM